MESSAIYLLSFGSEGRWSACSGGLVYFLGTPALQMGNRRQHTKANLKALGQRRYLLWTLLAICVLAIVVPVTVMFSKKKKSAPPKSNILVPLYVYPAPGAWDPLFTAITSYPGLNFTVVVNPASGPGMGAGPDGNYTREIPKLNAYGNVRTVGYVSTKWAERNLSLVLQDIGTYSAWSQNITAPGLGMNGIFLDETPSKYDDARAEFFETIESAVRSSEGLGINPLIIQNPGTLPDARFLSFCDVSVVFEDNYSTYQIYGSSKNISTFQANSKCSREKLACIMHGVPPTLSSNDMTSLVNDLRTVAGSVFVTSLSVDFYASFSSAWPKFTNEMAA